MAKHEIHFELPKRAIVNADAQFHVYSDEKLLGSLYVSRGTVEWRPSGFTSGFHLTWEAFGELMQKKGGRH